MYCLLHRLCLPSAPLGDIVIDGVASDSLAPGGIPFSTIVRVGVAIDPTTVTALPSTGTGESAGTSMMLAVLLSAITLFGLAGLAMKRRPTP